jgi:hypothetical protein
MCENKEAIKECVKELGYCDKELYKRFCEGKLCIGCLLEEPYGGCLLAKLRDSIEMLKEKQQ